jgi:hypothetical protein
MQCSFTASRPCDTVTRSEVPTHQQPDGQHSQDCCESMDHPTARIGNLPVDHSRGHNLTTQQLYVSDEWLRRCRSRDDAWSGTV